MPTLATSGQRICYFRRKAQMTLRTLSETNVTEATLRSAYCDRPFPGAVVLRASERLSSGVSLKFSF